MTIRTYVAFLIAIFLLATIAAFGNGEVSPGIKTYVGETKQMGDGKVFSWVTTDKDNKPMAIGITFSESALSNLPAKATEYQLAIPSKAKVPPYNHIAVDWEAQGHEPKGIYDKPHFDYHIYMISPAERAKITVTGEDLARVEKKPAPQYIPQGYIAFPGGIPMMGSHWADPNTPELHGGAFTSTFLYGFYNGQMAFIEPMIAKSYLETKPDITQKVSLPAAYQKHGYYPTEYSVKYDPANKQYTVSLGGLTYR